MREPMLLVNRETIVDRIIGELRRLRRQLAYYRGRMSQATALDQYDLWAGWADYYLYEWRAKLAQLRQLPTVSDCR